LQQERFVARLITQISANDCYPAPFGADFSLRVKEKLSKLKAMKPCVAFYAFSHEKIHLEIWFNADHDRSLHRNTVGEKDFVHPIKRYLSERC
jgi:hypothetical protein